MCEYIFELSKSAPTTKGKTELLMETIKELEDNLNTTVSHITSYEVFEQDSSLHIFNFRFSLFRYNLIFIYFHHLFKKYIKKKLNFFIISV